MIEPSSSRNPLAYGWPLCLLAAWRLHSHKGLRWGFMSSLHLRTQPSFMSLFYQWTGSLVRSVCRVSHSIRPPRKNHLLVLVKTNQQKQSLLLSSRLVNLCSTTKVCGIFGSSVLSSSYGEQPRSMAIIYVLGHTDQ